MKRTIAAAVLLLSAAGPALATDLFSLKDGPSVVPVPAANSWTGFYVGVNGGYGWDHALKFGDEYVDATTDPRGWLGGVTAGVDWQTNGIVLGLVTDIALANIADDSAITAGGYQVTNLHSTIDWFGTLRGRIGLPVANTIMPYGTGGLAYGGVSTRAVLGPYDFSADKTLFGWTAGAGVEWRMSPGWSLSTEWDHVDLGKAGVECSTGSCPDGNPGNVFDVARVILTYKIGQDMRHPVK